MCADELRKIKSYNYLQLFRQKIENQVRILRLPSIDGHKHSIEKHMLLFVCR